MGVRPPEEPLHAFPWASRAPGTGEEEVSAEPGGLGASALQGGAFLVSCGLFLPPLSAWGLQMSQCGLVSPKCTPGRAPLTSLGVRGGGSPPDPESDQTLKGTPAALGPGHRWLCAPCHLRRGAGVCPPSALPMKLLRAAPWKEQGPQDWPASQGGEPTREAGEPSCSPAPAVHLARWST